MFTSSRHWIRARALSALAAATVCLAAVCLAAAAGAVESRAVRFAIPQQSADTALTEFARQAGVSVLFPFDAVSGLKANALIGTYSIDRALRILLEGTGLSGGLEQGDTLIVRPDERTEPIETSAEKPRAEPVRRRAVSRRGRAAGALRMLDEITVTGTRIRRTPGMVTPVPVTAVEPEELAAFEPGGTVAEQLDVLPQFYRNDTAQRGGDGPGGRNVISGNGGGSYLNMRALGPQRTLVLLDGQRMMPADKRGSVNVDTLPTALIRSIDIVTGGASAAYGADAVGGVTNFVLDRDYEGLDIEAGSGITDRGDGAHWNFSVAGGTQLGERVNLIGSIEARHIDQIWRNPEDLDSWYKDWGYVTNPAWYPGAPAGIPQRLTLPWVASSRASPTGIIRARSGSSDSDPLIPFEYNEMTFLPDGSGVRPFDHGDVYSDPLSPGSTYTLSGGTEAEIFRRAFDAGPSGNEVVGRSAFAAAQYRVSDDLKVFAQILAGRSESNYVQMRGDYYLAGGQHATVFRDNAFLPEDIGLAMDAAGIDSFQLHKAGSFLGNIDPGQGAENTSAFTTYSARAGFDLGLREGWNLRATLQTGKSEKHTAVHDEIRIDRLFLAMDAVRDPATGDIVCRVQLFDPTPEQLRAAVADSGLESTRGGPLMSPIGLDDTVRDCVPFNVMGAGNMSRAAQDYVMTPVEGRSVVRQNSAEVLATGTLLEGRPYGPASAAFGMTWREQTFHDGAFPEDIDALGPPQNAPEFGIQGISPRWYASQPTLWQWAVLPTIGGAYNVWEWFGELDAPLWADRSGARRLDGSLAYRASHYSSNGLVESWKAGLDFQLIKDLRLRATLSRDVREANFSERFDSGVCSGADTVADPAFGGAMFQYVPICGGNPNLGPEIADTTVLGFVYEPRWAEGFNLSLDWYDISIKDAIGSLGFQHIVDQCDAGALSLCDQIVRDPKTGVINTIYDYYLNIDRSRVEGLDLEANLIARPNLFAGRDETLTLRLLAGYLIDRSDTPRGGVSVNTAGTLETPDLTAVVTARYGLGRYGIALQQRYVGDTIRNIDWVEGVDVDDNTVSSGTSTNLRVTYDRPMTSGGTMTFSLDVTNLFDRPPPIVPNTNYLGGDQLSDTVFDTFGRRYALSLRVRF
jgi:outer membrane receptor protein involved in Fe transport